MNYHTVKYRFKGKITHTDPGFTCNQGTDTTITVYMNPTPQVKAYLPKVSANTRDSLCFNEGTTFTISTPNTRVIGTMMYDLTVNNPGGVTGTESNGRKTIANLGQNLVNNSDIPKIVTYTLSPVIDHARPAPGVIDCKDGKDTVIQVTVFPEIKYKLEPKVYIGGNNIRCNGESNGSIRITDLKGGLASYKFKWNTNETLDSIYNKTKGKYHIAVTDYLGCVKRDSFLLTEPDPLNHSLTRTNVKCYGMNTGAINLTVTGGNTPMSYIWNKMVLLIFGIPRISITCIRVYIM
ncbi:MAG: hypothetical protein HC905_12000 [Bacteroidales bacterium]|nr:hypothetical protein [Bacteroidales bacterium]